MAPDAQDALVDVPQARRAGYWRANLRLITGLLLAWWLVAYLPMLLAEPLNQIEILTGFPLGYYMGAQGAPIAFVLLTFYYAWRMDRLDRAYGTTESTD